MSPFQIHLIRRLIDLLQVLWIFTNYLFFCDTSTRAYATVVYLRIKISNKFHVGISFCKAHLVFVEKGKRKTKFKP